MAISDLCKYSMLAPPTLYDSNRWLNLRIGLFGGSFNPPHVGHLHVAKMAQILFNLDAVWWLVTPQNPIKDKKNTPLFSKRYALVNDMLSTHPKQIATDLEQKIGTSYSYETISSIKRHYPKTDFLWICGMDNAHIFHRWDCWKEILYSIPATFIARPPVKTMIKQCPLRLMSSITHHHSHDNRHIDLSRAQNIYWINNIKMLDISSSQIRSGQK